MGLSIISHPFWGTPNVLETSRCISFKKNVGDPNDMVRAPLKMGSKMSYHASWTNARGKCDKVNQWSRKWTKTGSWPCTPVIVNDCGGSPHNTVCSGSQAEVSYLLARKPHIGYAIYFFSAGRARRFVVLISRVDRLRSTISPNQRRPSDSYRIITF